MTKGQKIIGSLLVVVAVGLVLNLSREVGGQDSPPPPEEVQTHSERAAQAIRDLRERRVQRREERRRAKSGFIPAQGPPPGFPGEPQRRPSMPQQALADQLSRDLREIRDALDGSPPGANALLAEYVLELRLELAEHDIRVEAQWLILSEDLDEYHWKVAARFKVLLKNQEAILTALGVKSPFAPIGLGVVDIHPGHPDFVVDDAERERMAKLFDELEAAEKKKETQDD